MNGPRFRHPGRDAGLHPIRHTWAESDRLLPRAFVQPAQRFAQTEQAGGVIMLVAAVIALVWANSPWWETYDTLWETTLSVELGDLIHLDHLTLRDWVNEGLMVIFFFVVALEIKRELVFGQLRDHRAAAVPVIAALGGMVVPAAVYLAFNAGGAGEDGWGIPMATDIAFALGVLAVAAPRIPSSARIFLLTLTIADDIGAIIVIAIFYTDDLSIGWLAVAAVVIAGVAWLQRIEVRSEVPVVVLAAVAWLAMLESGVSPTLAGVALGLLAPPWPFYAPSRYIGHARALVDEVAETFEDEELTYDELRRNNVHLFDLSRLSREAMSPLSRNLEALEPWVAFAIVPLFALANAGVHVTGDMASGVASDPVVLGVALGLLVGKPVGVVVAAWLAVRTGIGRMPPDLTWRLLTGVGIVAGVGFTVALFVAALAFEDVEALEDSAKIGILVGSAAAGVLGYLVVRTGPNRSRPG